MAVPVKKAKYWQTSLRLRVTCEPAVLADGVIHKEVAIEGLAPDRFADPRGLCRPALRAIHACGRVERRGVKHVGGIVHVLNVVVGRRPFDEYPALQFLQQSVLILEALEVIEQALDLGAQRLDRLAVAAPARYSSS